MDSKELKPLFDYMDEKFAQIDERFDRVEKKVDALQQAVDALRKEVKDFSDEHIVLYRKIEVLEEWAKKVSEKVGIPLPF